MAGTILALVFTYQVGATYYEEPFYSTELSISSPDTDAYGYLPDIVLCDPSPWDLVKAGQLNISQERKLYFSLSAN
jgi:hypothetical protein